MKDKNNKYYFFFGGFCSQWAPTPFYEKGIKYNTAEQYMMSSKAMVFNDAETLKKIRNTTDPKRQKSLGRKVKGFSDDVWDKYKYQVVKKANLLKFSQDENLMKMLIDTYPKIIVEASPYDVIWGIGMNANEEGINDEKNWRGTNLLGKVLMEIRDICILFNRN